MVPDDRAIPARVVQLEAQVANLQAHVDRLAEAYLDAGKLLEQLAMEVQGWKQAFKARRLIDSITDRMAGSE